MGRLVKLIGSGIGLATEAAAARKASNAQREQASQASSSSRSPPPAIDNDAPPQYVEVADSEADKLIASGKAVPADSKSAHHEEDSETDADEEAWELDEALETTYTETDTNTPEQTERQVIEDFLTSHPPPAYTERRGQLPCPVIIPQRRPRDKKRGFVRAYAPVLQECGIDQASFLGFLKSFHAASKASPWFQVINLAAGIVGFVPSVAAMAASAAVQVAVRVAMELQSRTRSSNFLDTLNKEYFQPRGLYCLIVTYKPESNATHERMDIMQAIQKSMNPATGMKGQLGKLKASSGKTYGEFEMPQSAPLIFPALDKLADDNTEEGTKKKSSIKSKSKFVTNYVDRRAQAKFAAENPGSSLAVAEQKFASRFSDPNHPVNSGSLISLVTGGAVNPRGLKGDRRVQRAIRRGQEVTPQTRRRRGGRQGIVRKMLRSDVLYMMIVNLPSEEETAATKRIFDEQGIQV